jgi:hypothetical protein
VLLQLDPAYLKLNSKGTVPTLVDTVGAGHTDKVVFETIDILQYVDKSFKGDSLAAAGVDKILKLVVEVPTDDLVYCAAMAGNPGMNPLACHLFSH